MRTLLPVLLGLTLLSACRVPVGKTAGIPRKAVFILLDGIPADVIEQVPTPVLDEIAQTYQGKLKVCKLNIDENQETPPKFGVRGIPTLMLFKNGNVEATKVGALSKSQLAAFLDSNI
jgi:thiol-disulfide isomerase/thioredoxin